MVSQFYQDISDRDYQGAWALGGDNIGGSSYSSWVTGYSTTASISLGEFSQFGSHQVQVDLSALQTDGSTRAYAGTYTVENGVITAADIVQTSAPQAAPAPAGLTSCGSGVFAGSSTSCPFAENVAAAYGGDGGPDVENVYSPVTGQSYAMTYVIAGAGTVIATGGNGAYVQF